MKEYPNFFENLQEFSRRLVGTIVTYDGEPYSVIAACGHKADGIFRVYLWPCKNGQMGNTRHPNPYDVMQHYPQGSNILGMTLDEWLKGSGKDSGVLRKNANSPLFNKYRPFPLGMMNLKGKTYYLVRQPSRHVEQGLTRNGVSMHVVGLVPQNLGGGVNLESPEFHDCVVGNYPTIQECLANMRDPEVTNESVAFHRDFAVVKGPLGLIFLVYKTDVVGFIPNTEQAELKLARKFAHLREVVTNTGAFSQITIE